MRQAITDSYLLETQFGIHDWSTDEFMLALYLDALDPANTTEYTAQGEVVGQGYTAGGVPLTLVDGFPMLSPLGTTRVLWNFEDVMIPNTSIQARYGLVYNLTKQNRSVAVLDFAQIYTTINQTFGIIWPTPDDNNAIIRLGA